MKQPAYDKEFAKICQWLKANKLTMHVKLNGDVSFRPKPPKPTGGKG